MGSCAHVYKSFHKSWGFAVKLFFTAPSFMQRLGPFVWQSLFLASRRQAWQRRPFGCAACRCFLFCCKRVPAWSVWAMVSKKPPWRLAGQRAFPDPSAHRSAAFCGTGHAEGRPGESIAIQWHLRAAAFASSEGTPLRRCLPPLSRPCRHICPLQRRSAKFSRICSGARQLAAGRVPPSSRPTRRRGEWGRNWPMFSCFTAPLCTLFRRSGCVFLHCAHCLFSLRLPGQSRGNAAKGIGSMV